MHGFGGVPRGHAKRLRELLAIPPLDVAAEELPAIADAGPDGELGNDAPILYNRSSRGFVRSPWVEEDLDEALRDRNVILLAGSSESGKWRTAWEAVRRGPPNARLLVPRLGMPVLAELLRLDPPLRPGPGQVVVWLDRLDASLATGNETTVKTMERLQSPAPRVVILTSVRGDVHTHLLGSQASFGPIARQLLAGATTIVVPAPDTPARRGWAGTGRSNADGERSDGIGAGVPPGVISPGGRTLRTVDDHAAAVGSGWRGKEVPLLTADAPGTRSFR